MYREETRGLENFPKTGPVVLMSNHATYLDPAFLGSQLPRPIRFMEWAQLFKVPGVAFFSRALKSFPVVLEKPDPSAYRNALRVLKAGEVLGIFPEGGRSADGLIHNMTEGGVRIAEKAGVPIVPVAISGGPAIWPKGRCFPKLGKKVILEIFPPLDPPKSKSEVSKVCKIIQAEINTAVIENEIEIIERFRPI
jgi:1-acyl-sn-glycerol-3-phosphate acyltransferase